MPAIFFTEKADRPLDRAVIKTLFFKDKAAFNSIQFNSIHGLFLRWFLYRRF